MTLHLRQHPRFVDEKRVSIAFANRDALKEAWTVDISKGGMFLKTDDPPPHGTRLEVHFETPDGTLKLSGEVVHVVDHERATAFGQSPGVGVQFVDLSKDVRSRIERYVDGLAGGLSMDLTGDVGHEPLEQLLDEARTIMSALGQSRFYDAFSVSPAATREEIMARVDELCGRFAHPPPDTTPPKAARLQQVARQLDRASSLFKNQVRRLQYDFQNGHVRAEERLKAGEDPEHLRDIWKQAFPTSLGEARELGRQALGMEKAQMFAECVSLIEKAIELDPFNLELRVARDTWTKEREVGALKAAPHKVAQVSGDKLLAELLAVKDKLTTMTFFELLGVAETADAQAIARAYLARSRRFHPDAVAGRLPPSMMPFVHAYSARLELAYKTLSDAPSRKAYQLRVGGGKDEAQDAATRLELGLVHLRKAEYQKARKHLEAALEGTPNNAQAKANLAWAMIADPSFDRNVAYSKGRRLLEEAIDSNTMEAAVKGDATEKKKRTARYHYYLGRLLRERDNPTAAVKHFNEALDLDPRLSQATTEIRLIHMRKKPKGLFG